MMRLTDNKLATISLLSAIVALLMVALVAWVHLSTQEKVEQLQLKLQNMQHSLDNADSLSAEIIQMREHIRQLEEKISQQNQHVQENKVESSTAVKIITPTTPVQTLEQKPQVVPKVQTPPSKTWMVVIASFDSLKKAKLAQKSKKMSTLQSTITTVHLKHGTWFRIVRSGFTNKASAQAFAKDIRRLGFKDAWVQYQSKKNK